MKTIFLSLAACLTGSALPLSAASFYLRPEAAWSHQKLTFSATGEPSDSWSGNKFSPGLAVGFTLGDQAQHDLSLGVSSLKFTDSSTEPDGLITETTTLRARTTPLLFSYRYLFGEATSPTRFYVGAIAGYAKLKFNGTYRATQGNTLLETDSFSYDDKALMQGGRLGVIWKINDQFSFDLGYSFTVAKFKFTDEEDDDFRFSMKSRTHSVIAGLAWNF